MVNTILAKRVNHIVAKGGNPVWPKGSKSRGFSTFYRVTPAEELISSCFRFAEPGEEGARLMSAAGIYAALKRKNPAVLRDCSCMGFSRLMAQVGRRVHTRYGNGYWVKPASSFDAPSALE